MTASPQDRPARRVRPVLRKLALSIVAFLLVIALAEISVRILSNHGVLDVSMTPVRFHRIDNICEYDSNVGWKNRANVDTVKGYYHGKVLKKAHEKTNSHGLRSPECAAKKPEGAFRIITLGCSRTYGLAVEQDETYPHHLSALLNGQCDRKVEVLNFGVNGYGLDQMALLFEHHAKEFQPDLVFLQLYGPNVDRMRYNVNWQTPKPVFRMNGDELVLRNVPVPRKRLPKLQKWLIRRSYLFAFMKNRLTGAEHADRAEDREKVSVDADAHLIASRILARLKTHTDELGVPLAVFIWSGQGWLGLTVENAGVELVVLADHEPPGPWETAAPLNNPAPAKHWSPNGNRYVATALRNFIVSSGLLATNGSPASLFP